MHPILQRKLLEIVEARRAVRLRWANAWLMVLCSAAIGTAVLMPGSSEHYMRIVLGVAGALFIGGLLIKLLVRPEKFDAQKLAREVEAENPELAALLLTAVEQKAGATGLSYLQERVVNDAVKASVKHLWSEELTAAEQKRAAIAGGAALVCLVLTCGGFVWQIIRPATKPEVIAEEPKTEAKKPEPPKALYEVEVTPGDTEVEKGSRLVVEAKFAKDLPPDATLVRCDAKGIERERLPMKPTVDAKVFGGLISNLKEDGVYRVEFEGQKSRDFKITTFVFPELVRADATVTPPAYTKQPAKEIKNTLKVTLMEGSQLAYKLKINKSVAQAELFADKDHIIELKASKDDTTMLEAAWVPDETRKYRLHLVDDRERSSKQTPVFSINVIKNSLPKIEIAFPKRDAKVSPLQELALEAKVWDDVSVHKAGAVIDIADEKKDIALALTATEPGKKVDVKTLLNLEPEGVEPQQLVSYYFWAEDKDAKGETRRTMSDMFFAEVRAFEDIFRETEPPPPSEEGGKESKTDELAKLQKDIVNANWRLQRDQAGGKAMTALKPDVDTVMTSQAINQEKLDEAIEEAKDPRVKAPLEQAKQQMQIAEKTLALASEKADSKALNDALKPEQSALRLIYQAQNNEHRVTKANPKTSKGQGQPQEKEELSMLELKQKEQRYEEEKQAGEEKTAEQQENLVVLNRLKELARRQEALAEKMKQLEQQLAQAKSEDQKEELANQLKRLQEEQDQLLRDLDDLKERMEKPENASNMADAKKQLEETREKVTEAAEKLKDENLAQASSAASRAQKELEKARDDFRQRTARRFGEEMKAMRDAARELAQEQQKLTDQLENRPGASESKDASDTTAALKQRLTGAQASRKMDEQKERATKLMEDMKRVSEQAEASEPLLHKHLYDALRGAQTQGLEENLAEASAQSRYGDASAAQDAERKASKSVEQLKSGVEKAAESVLGNESEALRMARSELDKLINEAKAEGDQGKEGGAGSKESKADSDAKVAAGKGDKPGEKGTDGKDQTADAKGKGDKPGQNGSGDTKGDEAKTADAKGDKPGQGAKGQTKDGKGEVAEGEGKDGNGEQADKEGEGQGKMASASQGEKGDGEGKGEGQGEKPGEKGEGKGEGKGQMAAASESGEGEGEGGPPGAKGQGQDGKSDDSASRQASASSKGGQHKRGGQRAANDQGGGGDWFFDEASEVRDDSPITGDRYDVWSDRLRNLEEMLSNPELRNEAATVLDRARHLRSEFQRAALAPSADHLNSRIISPLVELRDKVTEELARREGKNPLSPVDRDPVPEAYRELVQKYYEQLGAGK